MNETEVAEALDEQEAYIADRKGTLHRSLDAPFDSDEDWRKCETCGENTYDLFMCPSAPTGRCGCPLYIVRDGEHLPHE